MLSYSRIILGVSGSIAAYKTALLTRLLVRQSSEVQVLMTPAATRFITPLTLSTLSKKPVLTDVLSEDAWNNHVELGLWADALIVAPATANTLAKLANGICDNILTAVYLSARCPVFIAPAMDVDMWKHPSTRHNIARLQEAGARIIPVGHGELASGLVGDGRMAEPEDIIRFLSQHPPVAKDLTGKKALVTAGPTFEPLDPVRFLGNHSTGKMGIAIAETLAERGATVDLVLGPTALRPNHPDVHTVPVQTAQEMFDACKIRMDKADIIVLAAAVADYRPETYSPTKIKKKDEALSIQLAKTVDIAATLGSARRPGQVFAGFALETDQEEKHALDKLQRKNFDFIVLNSLNDPGAGFGHDTNKITILGADGSRRNFALKSKIEAARDIADEIAARIHP